MNPTFDQVQNAFLDLVTKENQDVEKFLQKLNLQPAISEESPIFTFNHEEDNLYDALGVDMEQLKVVIDDMMEQIGSSSKHSLTVEAISKLPRMHLIVFTSLIFIGAIRTATSNDLEKLMTDRLGSLKSDVLKSVLSVSKETEVLKTLIETLQDQLEDLEVPKAVEKTLNKINTQIQKMQPE